MTELARGMLDLEKVLLAERWWSAVERWGSVRMDCRTVRWNYCYIGEKAEFGALLERELERQILDQAHWHPQGDEPG